MGGQTNYYIWGRINSKGHTGQVPPGGEPTGHVVGSARFRQSERQEGQEAAGVSKTSDQRCDPGVRVMCICYVFKTESGGALGTSLMPTAH